jgi:D-alanyl-D-alanine dipeptidase
MSTILHKLTKVTDLTNDFILDLKYASTDNFTGLIVPGYHANIFYLSNEATLALMRCIADFKKLNYRVKILDAYRPQKAVDFFVRWRSIPEDLQLKRRFHPKYTKEELFSNLFIMSPSSHSRGSTIDLTLIDSNNNELDMGTEFDFFHHTSSTHYQELPAHIIKNRQILCSTLEKNGFKNLESEWWHYTLLNEPYPDQYFDFDIQ